MAFYSVLLTLPLLVFVFAPAQRDVFVIPHELFLESMAAIAVWSAACAQRPMPWRSKMFIAAFTFFGVGEVIYNVAVLIGGQNLYPKKLIGDVCYTLFFTIMLTSCVAHFMQRASTTRRREVALVLALALGCF